MGINLVDMDVLSDAGVNWADVSRLSMSGINWNDVDVFCANQLHGGLLPGY